MQIWGQVISLIAMSAIILSFQCKSNKKLVIVLGTGALLFAASYFLLGQLSAAIFNILVVITSLVCLNNKLKNKYIFIIIVSLYATATYFTYDGLWSLILMLAQFTSTYSLMFGNGTFIRNTRFFFVSPIWLINNTFICFSAGGMICEIITMASVIISFIRYRKTGFEE